MRAGADTAEWYELRFVDVGGCRLALRDAGQGEPVVVLEMGLGAGGAFYDDIARAVSAFTRVVWYDRAGLGQSDLAPTPRTIADLTRDLQALLRAARIPGPYVLVGHSLGGLTVRFYQHRHPREVAALVLIDAAHEEQRERLAATLPPAAPGEHAAIAETRHSLRVNWADPAMNAEGIDNIANSSLMRGCGDLGDLPPDAGTVHAASCDPVRQEPGTTVSPEAISAVGANACATTQPMPGPGAHLLAPAICCS